MKSLQSRLPHLAKIFGTTVGALYERQRALVRAELIDRPTGRGPGNGTPSNPPTEAMLILSFLSADRLNDVGEKTRKLAFLTTRNWERCPVTGGETLHEVITWILDRGLDCEISVSRTACFARIGFSSSVIVRFGAAPKSDFSVTAYLRTRDLLADYKSHMSKKSEAIYRQETKSRRRHVRQE